MNERSWAGNHRYRATALHRPTTLDQVRELVAGATRLRPLGSRHSFTAIADSTELLSLDRLPADVVVDHAAGTVSFAAGLRYGELAETLRAEGVAPANLASLPHISVAGLDLVTASGDVLTVSRGDDHFDEVTSAGYIRPVLQGRSCAPWPPTGCG